MIETGLGFLLGSAITSGTLALVPRLFSSYSSSYSSSSSLSSSYSKSSSLLPDAGPVTLGSPVGVGKIAPAGSGSAAARV